MKKLFLCSSVFVSTALFSQTSNGCDSTLQAKEGTYKLIKLTPSESLNNSREMLSENGLCYIESVRKTSDTVVVFLESYKVVVYPLTVKKKKP